MEPEDFSLEKSLFLVEETEVDTRMGGWLVHHLDQDFLAMHTSCFLSALELH